MDSWDADELRGVAIQHAHEHITSYGSQEERICGKQACDLALKVANSTLEGDLSSLKDELALSEQDAYKKKEFNDAVKAEVDKLLSKEKEAKSLITRNASKAMKYSVDVYCDQGRRPQMEDKHVAFEDLNALLGLEDKGLPHQAFFAVYDGHGGVDAAEYAAAQLHLNVVSDPNLKNDPASSLVNGFKKTDEKFLQKAEREHLTSGAAACAVLLRPKRLDIAWLGDSQAVLCRAGKAVALMKPHKPQNEDEKTRIEKNGGVVVWYGAWRVNGILSVARAIGDRKLKQWVIGDPDHKSFDLDGTEEFLVIACDGLWDVMDNDGVVKYVKDYLDSKKTHQGLAKAMVTHCIQDLDSTDNISCIVVFFDKK